MYLLPFVSSLRLPPSASFDLERAQNMGKNFGRYASAISAAYPPALLRPAQGFALERSGRAQQCGGMEMINF